MNEAVFIVEYKTANELFAEKFAYTSVCKEIEGLILFINDNDGAELEIRKQYLEWSLCRPIRIDEEL